MIQAKHREKPEFVNWVENEEEVEDGNFQSLHLFPSNEQASGNIWPQWIKKYTENSQQMLIYYSLETCPQSHDIQGTIR